MYRQFCDDINFWGSHTGTELLIGSSTSKTSIAISFDVCFFPILYSFITGALKINNLNLNAGYSFNHTQTDDRLIDECQVEMYTSHYTKCHEILHQNASVHNHLPKSRSLMFLFHFTTRFPTILFIYFMFVCECLSVVCVKDT